MTSLDRLTAALSDRYTIERELGQGGMATVYLAHDIKHDRDVAIKVLHPDLGAALGAERFLTEIRTTARLQHPHILPLLDSGDADGLLYYVMPLVTGETLRARLERERQLPIADAVLMAREVADALGYAHGLGVIHRDIKPENILLQGGHALVADFGIALAVQSAGGARMTQTGLSLGTPQYMSPEQAMGERSIDARSDIYALGAVTYEMLTGDPPFTGATVQAIVAKVMTERPTPIHTLRDTVPPGMEAAVLTALAKLPADRFATAAVFATALVSPRATGPSDAHLRSRGATGIQTRTRDPLLLGLGAIVVLVIGALIGWLSARRGGAPSASDSSLIVTSILAPAGGSYDESRSLALSPDGRQLAFVFATNDGSRMLWRRDLDRLDAQPITGSAGATAPFWSPDGRSLGYFANGFLVVRDADGASRQLCPVADPTGGSWSTAGLILFGGRHGLATVHASGGDCHLVIPDTTSGGIRGIFLPDGSHFIYSRGVQRGIVVATVDGRLVDTLAARATEFAVAQPGYLLTPAPNDALGLDAHRFDLASFALDTVSVRVVSGVRNRGGIDDFSVSSNGAMVFLPAVIDPPYFVYDANGTLRDSLPTGGAWTIGVRPPSAGKPFVAAAGAYTGIWLIDLDASRGTRLTQVDSVAARTGRVAGTTWPVFDPTGARLAYLLQTPRYCRIMERDLRTDIERTVRGDSNGAAARCAEPLDWSPDGTRLLVRRDTILQLVSADNGTVVQEIRRPGRLLDARFSPDGRALAYSSDETGRAEVYIQPLPTGIPILVSRDGGRWPYWTHDGRRIVYLAPDGRVQEATLEAPAGRLAAIRTRFSLPTWRRSTFDDNGAGFVMVGDGERYVVRRSPASAAVAYLQNWPLLMQAANRSRPAPPQ